jgi:hypothetical protein
MGTTDRRAYPFGAYGEHRIVGAAGIEPTFK